MLLLTQNGPWKQRREIPIRRIPLIPHLLHHGLIAHVWGIVLDCFESTFVSQNGSIYLIMQDIFITQVYCLLHQDIYSS